MKWRSKPIEGWRDWYAWFPVTAGNYCYWLTRVQRKWVHNAWTDMADIWSLDMPGYVYRPPNGSTP